MDRADDELAKARADAAGCGGMSGAVTGRRRMQFWTEERDRRLEELRAAVAADA